MGGGSSGTAGPTAAAAAAAAQKQKTLMQRMDNDVGNLVDNFGFMINGARVYSLFSLLTYLSFCSLICLMFPSF